MNLLFVSLILVSAAPSLMDAKQDPRGGKVVICYYGSWARYRPDHGKVTLNELKPELCTHLIYTFAGLDPEQHIIKSLDPYNDLEENYGLGSYKKITDFKKTTPGLKVLIAIGGWNEGSKNYSLMANNDEWRGTFVKSALEFVKKYNFDGLDLDWEYPTQRGGEPSDREAFVKLVQELKEIFAPEGLMITAAVGAGPAVFHTAYNFPKLAPNLDYFHVMTYDYHGIWDKKTGANSPLHGDVSMEGTIKEYIARGVPYNKLVLGLPLYGRTFLLKNSSDTFFNAPAQDTALQGPWTKQDGFMGFNEICLELRQEGWKQHFDKKAVTPFVTNGEKFITYDNDKSLDKKVRFAIRKGLAGVMVWTIDTDDIYNDCGHGSYSLLKAINFAVEDELEQIALGKGGKNDNDKDNEDEAEGEEDNEVGEEEEEDEQNRIDDNQQTGKGTGNASTTTMLSLLSNIVLAAFTLLILRIN